MILVDSSVWIDYFNGQETPQTNKLDAMLGLEPLAIGDLMLVEVLQGFCTDQDFAQARALLLSLPVYEMLGVDKALQSAEYYRSLRKKGITIRKTVDVLIATFCIVEGHRLLFSDRDFIPFVDHFGLLGVSCGP